MILKRDSGVPNKTVRCVFLLAGLAMAAGCQSTPPVGEATSPRTTSGGSTFGHRSYNAMEHRWEEAPPFGANSLTNPTISR